MSRSKVKGKGNRWQKNDKNAAFCCRVVLWVAVLVRHFIRELSSGAAVHYAGGKISACCLVYMFSVYFIAVVVVLFSFGVVMQMI